MYPTELSILLIEDSLAEAELLQDLLVESKVTRYELHHCLRLSDAMMTLHAETFDIILLDLSLPDSQGLDSLPILMNLVPETPIVVLTNTNDSETALEAVHQGAQDYLIKKNIASDQETLLRSLLYAIERKKNQTALKEANERLRLEMATREKIQQKLIQSNEELAQFAYIASHDLKQPLASIYSWSQLLQNRHGDRLDGKGQGYIKSMQDSVKQMTQLIDDILIYSRVERANDTYVEVDCNVILHQVIKRLSAAIATHHAQLSVDNLPHVLGNPLQIGQVMQNLIENALKYRRADIVPEIHIAASQKDKFWMFSCQDNGIGIAAEYYDQIFYAFKRLHSQAEYPGTGVGLAVCKKIIKRHGGKIWLESTIEQGSTFYFTLPVVPHKT